MSTKQEYFKALISVKNFSKYGDEEFMEVDLINQNDLELKVKIYPCAGEFVSIYFARETAERPFSAEEVECFVSVIDCKGNKCYTQSFTFYNRSKEDVFIFGCQQCFNRTEILDVSGDLITDDVLNLEFDFIYKGKNISKSILNAGKFLINLADGFQRKRELQNKTRQRLLDLPAALPDALKSVGVYLSGFLNTNEEWITIETMHGTQHHIRFREGMETVGSKLCAASPVFSRLLKSPMQEKEDKRIKIIDFDASTFSAFLHFIDCGEINWTGEFNDFYSLYEMSDKYEALELMKKCSNYLAENIKTDNVVDIAKLATMHSDIQLKKAVAAFCTTKETLFARKISILVLSRMAEKVKLKSTVPVNFAAKEVAGCLQRKQVIFLRSFEDACILYVIADDFEMHDMMINCAQYMKQNISPENARVLLSYVKQFHNRLPLYFVKSYVRKTAKQCVEEAFGTRSTKDLSSTSSEESIYFSCDGDEVEHSGNL